MKPRVSTRGLVPFSHCKPLRIAGYANCHMRLFWSVGANSQNIGGIPPGCVDGSTMITGGVASTLNHRLINIVPAGTSRPQQSLSVAGSKTHPRRCPTAQPVGHSFNPRHQRPVSRSDSNESPCLSYFVIFV